MNNAAEAFNYIVIDNTLFEQGRKHDLWYDQKTFGAERQEVFCSPECNHYLIKCSKDITFSVRKTKTYA